jgi:hypothetical protein
MSQSRNDNEINMFKELFIKDQTYKDVIKKIEVWQDLESTYSGKLRIKRTKTDHLITLILNVLYKDHEIILTESDTKPLKFEVEFQLNTDFEFVLGPQDSIERILKVFGKQDVMIGNAEFDKKYMIQSSNPELVKRVLHPISINQGILKHKLSSISLQYQKKTELSKLLLVKDRNTKSGEVVSNIIQLMCTIIDSMDKNQIIKRKYGLQQ